VVTGLTGQSAGPMHMLSTSGGDRFAFFKWFAYIRPGGSCIGSGGACMCAGVALCGFRDLVWWFALFA
jgi:hypothetical protein